MTDRQITISGTGSALMDYLYGQVDFNSQAFRKYLSRKSGDGGLHPGRLVFVTDLERFAGKSIDAILPELVSTAPDTSNIGGPAVVSLIHAAQMLNSSNFEVRFYGAAGDDKTGKDLMQNIKQTPLKLSKYRVFAGTHTPFTNVLSDPNYHEGAGERTFINNIGAAWKFTPKSLDNDFFNSDIITFGGTALVPHLHDNLTELLQKGKKNGGITVVNTVYDFRNEQKHPGEPWPLGEHKHSLPAIDLLLMDEEEALKISGKADIDAAIGYFRDHGTHAFIITRGSKEVIVYSDGELFTSAGLYYLPVSERVVREMQENPENKGDTTGCGDNFAGGAIASLARQMAKDSEKFSLKEIAAWGVASGGFACFYFGGTYLENSAGEKYHRISPYVSDYKNQIQDVFQ